MANALHTKILDQVVVELKAISWGTNTINDNNIKVVFVPTEDLSWLPQPNPYPAIAVSPVPLFETIDGAGGTNASDDIGYPAHIALIDGGNLALTANTDKWLYWRELIIDKLIKVRWPAVSGLSGVLEVNIEPGPIADLNAWFTRNILASLVVARARTRKVRRA